MGKPQLKEPEMPECDKLLAVKDESQAIGTFLDWLRHEKGIALAEDKKASWFCETCGDVPKEEVYFVDWCSNDDAYWRHKAKHCKKVQKLMKKGSIPVEKYQGDVVEHIPAGLYPAPTSVDKLLHEYFEIDAEKVETERRALLDFMRNKSR